MLDKEPKFRQAGMAAVADPEKEKKTLSSQQCSGSGMFLGLPDPHPDPLFTSKLLNFN